MTQSDTEEIPATPGGEDGTGPWLRSRRAKILVVAAAAVILIAALAIVPHFASGRGGGGTTDAPPLATAAVRSFTVTAAANGTVVPASEMGVNFSTPGTLASISVHVGQQVTPGTVLAQLDNTTAQGDISKAQSAVTSAQTIYNQTVAQVQTTAANESAAVAGDQQQLTSDQQRTTTNGCSATAPTNALVCQNDQAAVASDQNQLRTDQGRQQSDAASGQLSISQAQSSLNAANAQLVTAKDELTGLTLTAPAPGTVLQINGQIGENVSGTSTSGSTLPGTSTPIPNIVGAPAAPGSQPFMMIGDQGSFVIGAAFPANDLPALNATQTGTITDTSLNGLSVPCHMVAVASMATTVNGTSIVYATVAPIGQPSGLYSGQQVSVSINESQANRVLAIPQSAVYLVSGVPHVDVWNGSRSVSTAIQTGSQGSSLIQVSSGLNAGQQVVLSPGTGLQSSSSSAIGGAA